MKLAKDEIIRSEDASPLQLFSQGIRAEATHRKYTATLRRITCEVLEDVLEGSFEERVVQFVQHGRDDPDWMLDLLISLSWKLRGRAELPRGHSQYLNPTSFKTYFKPLRKLLEMNNVTVNWKRVYATFPERNNILDTKGWTREEISAILGQARDPMDRAVVLLLASSGVRLGGLNMTWGDLTPIYLKDGHLTEDPGDGGEVACLALNVYAGSPERYTAFATPEAYRAIQEYGRMWADLMNRQPGPKDHLFLATKLLPRRASEPAIAKRVRRMAAKAGLRDPASKSGSRFETQLVHGFRKFFNKTCKETLSGDSLASLIRTEYMMGHMGLVSLDQNYFKTSMLEMAVEYVKVVPDLTINDSERIKQSNQRMSANIQQLESEKDATIAHLARKVSDLEKQQSRGVPAMLDLIKRTKGTEGVDGADANALAGFLEQINAAHRANIREIEEKNKREIDELKKVMAAMIKPPSNPEDDPRLQYLTRVEADMVVDEEEQQRNPDPRRRLD